MLFAYSYSQPTDGKYTVDIVIDDQYPYNEGEYTAKAAVDPSLPLYTHELVIQNGIARAKNADETMSELRSELYSEITRMYDSVKNTAVRYLPLRDSVLIPLRVSFDDISLLESGYKVLSDLNDESGCFVKDYDNVLHQCTLAELAGVIKHARFAAMSLWKQKVYLQETLASKSIDELRSGITWINPPMDGFPGHWL